jgi:xanthosine utilization system XapX-like protein
MTLYNNIISGPLIASAILLNSMRNNNCTGMIYTSVHMNFIIFSILVGSYIIPLLRRLLQYLECKIETANEGSMGHIK